jgi:hypothetical protein
MPQVYVTGSILDFVAHVWKRDRYLDVFTAQELGYLLGNDWAQLLLSHMLSLGAGGLVEFEAQYYFSTT